MMTALTVATIALFTLLRTDLHLSELESYALLGAYSVFVAWLVLGIFGLSPVPVPAGS
jgi:cation:H+ antiporter